MLQGELAKDNNNITREEVEDIVVDQMETCCWLMCISARE